MIKNQKSGNYIYQMIVKRTDIMDKEKLIGAIITAFGVYRRINCMTRTTKSMVRGVTIGMTVGAVAGIAGGIVAHSNKKMIKRKTGRAVDYIGDLVDNVTYLFK